MRNFFSKQRSIISKTGQPATVNMALAHWKKKDPQVQVKIHFQDRLKTYYISTVTVQTISNSTTDMLEFLRDTVEGGSYYVEFCRGELVLNSYRDCNVAGPAGPYSKKARNVNENGGGRRPKDPTFMESAFLKLLENKDGGGNMYGDMLLQMFEHLMTNMTGGESRAFELLAQVREAATMFQPQVAPQEPLVAALQSLGPLVTQLMMSRGNKQQPSQADLASVMGSPEMQAVLANPEVQKALQQQRSQQPAAQPAPGAFPTRNVPMTPPGTPAVPIHTTPSPQPDPMVSHHIGKFQQAIIEGAPPDKLADHLHWVVELQKHALKQDSNAMNPLMAGFVQHSDPLDPIALSSDLDGFCDAIPELAARPDLRAGLRMSFAAKYGLVVENVAVGSPTPRTEKEQPGPEPVAESSEQFDQMTEDEKTKKLQQEFREAIADAPGETDHEANSGLGENGKYEDHGHGPEAGGAQFDEDDPETSNQH